MSDIPIAAVLIAYILIGLVTVYIGGSKLNTLYGTIATKPEYSHYERRFMLLCLWGVFAIGALLWPLILVKRVLRTNKP